MKKFSLLFIMMFALLLIWCGNRATIDENNDEEVVVNEVQESDFNKSDCIKWCEMMQNKEWEKEWMLQLFENCESLCNAWEAMETNDASGCEDSEGVLRDSCYSSVAYETGNPDLCKKLTDWLLQFGCYTSIAEKTKDISICDNIDDKMRKTSCEIWAQGE